MKTLLLILFFACSSLHAYMEQGEILSAKIPLQNGNGYVVLSDRSCWKVVVFTKRWRNLDEWWNNVQIVPENYECKLEDWHPGTPIAVYLKSENQIADEANASNQEDLRQCPYILVNRRTQKVLFAIPMEPAECLLTIFKEAYTEGHAAGYRIGYSTGTQASYTTGYELGYNNGYQEGKAVTTKEESR